MSLAARRVLGIDPGLRITGWGLVERVEGGFRLLGSGTLRPDPQAQVAARLACLHKGVLELVAAHAPEVVVVEEAFAGVNARSAIRLGEARAVSLLAAELSGCAVHELPPALVKKAVAGHGRASKDAVRAAVQRALGVELPESAPSDESDALALAVTGLTRLEAALATGVLSPIGRRQGRGRRRARWTAADLDRLRETGS